MDSVGQYFSKHLNSLPGDLIQTIQLDMSTCNARINHQLTHGHIQIGDQPTHIAHEDDKAQEQGSDSNLLSKRRELQRALQGLRRGDFGDDGQYKRAKQAIILEMQEQIRREKEQKIWEAQQVEGKVRGWVVSQRELLTHKEKKAIEEQKAREEEEKVMKQKEERERAAAILQKKKQIQQKLNELKQKKEKRNTMMISTRSKSQDNLPLYLEYQKRYMQVEYEKKFEEDILKKNKRLSKKIDYEALRSHDKQFSSKIKQRNQAVQQSRARTSSQMPAIEFKKYTNRSEEKIREQLERQQKRLQYQDRLKEIPIEVDEAKRIKLEIAIDRAKNPFKYHFLSQKNLNDFQIYGEFKNFGLNCDAKQIGNKYFQQVKWKIRNQQIKPSSAHLTKDESFTSRPKYRNYLHELKQRIVENQEQKDDLARIVKQKDKQKALIQLSVKSSELEKDVVEKIRQLNVLKKNDVKGQLLKQSEIDDVYCKALKARLAFLQISS